MTYRVISADSPRYRAASCSRWARAGAGGTVDELLGSRRRAGHRERLRRRARRAVRRHRARPRRLDLPARAGSGAREIAGAAPSGAPPPPHSPRGCASSCWRRDRRRATAAPRSCCRAPWRAARRSGRAPATWSATSLSTRFGLVWGLGVAAWCWWRAGRGAGRSRCCGRPRSAHGARCRATRWSCSPCRSGARFPPCTRRARDRSVAGALLLPANVLHVMAWPRGSAASRCSYSHSARRRRGWKPRPHAPAGRDRRALLGDGRNRRRRAPRLGRRAGSGRGPDARPSPRHGPRPGRADQGRPVRGLVALG